MIRSTLFCDLPFIAIDLLAVRPNGCPVSRAAQMSSALEGMNLPITVPLLGRKHQCESAYYAVRIRGTKPGKARAVLCHDRHEKWNDDYI